MPRPVVALVTDDDRGLYAAAVVGGIFGNHSRDIPDCDDLPLLNRLHCSSVFVRVKPAPPCVRIQARRSLRRQ